MLFGREFPLDSVLQMWDIIFAIDSSLELVDFIAISLLLRIRWQLIAADTNEALTLLLKYPDPATPAHTFVKDALYLRDHLNPQGGADVISRYGKQAPVFEQEITLVASAMLPPQSPVLDTGRQDPSSPTRMISQSGQRIEALLQGAAKNVMEAGSSWVVGKALRAAVGEARRNVETFAAGPQPGQISSEFRNKQYRQQRQPVPKVGGSSPIIHGVEQEGATKQMETLKKRNNELADMLATAVQDLWDYHKERSQQQNDSGASAEEMQSVEALSLAIAQIQVIQIYLQDSTIPLPKAAATEGSFSTEGSVKQFSPTASEHKSTEPFVAEAPQSMLPSANAPSSPLLSKIGSHSARPSSLEASLSTQVPSRPYSHARPQLASSSFSWILGEDSIRTNFATDMAHSTLSSDGRRRSRGKGFLFGDDEDDFGIVAGHDRRSLSSTSGRRGVKSTRMKHTSGEESLEDMIVLNRMTKEGAE